MKYTCPRCGYFTFSRFNIRKHFKRKRICQITLENISIDECFKTVLHEEINEIPSSITKVSQNEDLGITKVSQRYHKSITKSENSAILQNFFKCKNCEKQFSQKNNYYRHVKHYCKNLQISLNANELYEEKLAQTRVIDKLKKENEGLRKSKNMTIQNNSITTNNININAFGKENLNYVSKEYIHGLIREGPYGSIRKLIKYIHFNPDHKENHNIKIPNKRDKYAMVYDGSMWQVKNKKNMITTIADHAYGVIAEHCEDITSKKFDRFRDDFESEESRYMKKLAEDTELIILNGQKEIGLH